MNYTMMCDAYELTMANSYYNSGKSNETAVFDVFFRKVPNDGGYAIMAGLDKVIDYISNLKFTSEDIEETISDVFVALWMARDKIEVTKDCGLKEYLYDIARKTALNRRRKLMRVQSGVSDEEIDDADAAGKLVASDDVEQNVIKNMI